MKHLISFSSGTSLLACLLCVLTLFFSSCGDNENVNKKQKNEEPELILPEARDKQPFVVTNLCGELSYDKELKEWIIYPEREQSGMFIQLGDEEGAYMIISDMKKEYANYAGSITFSGKAAMKHLLIYNSDIGAKTYVYTIELSRIAPAEENGK